ncbi:hypothetical protein L1987_01471 [Smallanthus sonchifolius]|uniref:Uncharacterized protein n=1 Tax=Smallanthus sonchifolius TaxID=185202 RepID=A0ACB9K575_9ASTR|nr:hypothetical protein L1987_01471 [Smallanthus sonchifolius]
MLQILFLCLILGEDTRYTFTDHLYKVLLRAGLRIFRDDDVIPTGEVLKPEIESAIIKSRASIVVLSENYAYSKWCLDELWLILEQRRKCTWEVVEKTSGKLEEKEANGDASLNARNGFGGTGLGLGFSYSSRNPPLQSGQSSSEEAVGLTETVRLHWCKSKVEATHRHRRC